MNGFNAFLMPYSFLRRWTYDELIPSLLYFDRVTFLMDDITRDYVPDKTNDPPNQPKVRLRSPQELKGFNKKDIVDGLFVEQHHYYYPMRDLMKEEVIVISSMDLWIDSSEHREDFQKRLTANDPIAQEFLIAATQYYDFLSPEQSSLTEFEKAMMVKRWIKQSLIFPRRNWQQVTLHPNGYRALLSAFSMFPDLYKLSRAYEVDNLGNTRANPVESYAAMHVIINLLREELTSWALTKNPEALSDILEIRLKYRSELEAFRKGILEATETFRRDRPSLQDTPSIVDEYLRKVQPIFHQTKHALADPLRFPKLVLQKAGAMVMIGLGVGLGGVAGTALAGPIGTAVGSITGVSVATMVGQAVAEGTKEVTAKIGEDIASIVRPKQEPVDKTMVYLFHAQQRLQRSRISKSKKG